MDNSAPTPIRWLYKAKVGPSSYPHRLGITWRVIPVIHIVKIFTDLSLRYPQVYPYPIGITIHHLVLEIWAYKTGVTGLGENDDRYKTWFSGVFGRNFRS